MPLNNNNNDHIYKINGPKTFGRTRFITYSQSRLKNFFNASTTMKLGAALILAFCAALLTYPAPENYQPGEIADRTIRADRDLSVLDLQATQTAREEARDTVGPVLDLNDLLPEIAAEQARKVFERARSLSSSKTPERQEQLAALKNDFYQAFQITPHSDLWERLAEKKFDPQIERTALRLVLEISAQGLVESEEDLTGFNSKPASVVTASTQTEHSLPSTSSIMTSASGRRALDLRLDVLKIDFSAENADLILTLAKAALKPNLTVNIAETERRRRNAALAVSDVNQEIKAGEVIIREGSQVTPRARLLIEALQADNGKRQWHQRFGGLFIILAVFLTTNLTMVTLSGKNRQNISRRQAVLLFLLALSVIILAHLAGQLGGNLSGGFDHFGTLTLYYLMPFPCVAILTAIFAGIRRAWIMALATAVLAAAVAQAENLALFIYTYNGSLAALWFLRKNTDRIRLIAASFAVAFINCLTLAGLSLFGEDQLSQQIVYNFAAAACSGILAGVLAGGLTPLIELCFGLPTNHTILELGSLDRAMLRELMLSAPGTYHHSVIVGAMVEAAAEAISANPSLAKVGAYYHDIGKLKKPEYFVENQTGENKHDKLAPSMSALVLVGHVKDGVELAKSQHLPQALIDIIEQHHGTSLMAYFYHKAKTNRPDQSIEINEADYRYPGPKPRSKEAGLVMLADICEAATKSLAEPSPVKIQNLVHQLVSQVFNDGQLDDCDLTVQELSISIKCFVTILIGIYHHRIAYPHQKKKDEIKDADSHGSLPDESAKRPAR